MYSAYPPHAPQAAPPEMYDAGAGRSGSPAGAAATTTYGGRQSPLPAGAHFNQHFDTVSRALDSVGISGPGGGSPLPPGAAPPAPPSASPRAAGTGWGGGAGAMYPASEQAYGKTVAVVAAQTGQTENFRIAVGESGDNIREAIRGAFALGQGCSFTLRDAQQCNVVLGFPSLADGGRYMMYVTQQQPGQSPFSPRAYAPPSPAGRHPAAQQWAPAPQQPAAPAAAAYAPEPAAQCAATAADPAAASPRPYVPAGRRQRQTQRRPPSAAAGAPPGPKHGVHSRQNPIPRTRKALIVGINYIGMKEQVPTSVDDARRMEDFIAERGFGAQDTGQHWTLTDDNEQGMPTKQNIMRGVDWLVDGAQPGDSLLFHYSGHGAEFKDDDGEDDDAFEEALLPADFKNKDQGGYRIIRDDDIVRSLIVRLQRGVRLTIVCDCCHSGTMVDLPYKMKALKSGEFEVVEEVDPPVFLGDVVMLSGVRDAQTSPDLSGNGALTGAFIDAVTKDNNPTYESLLLGILRGIQAHPQLGSERCHIPMLSATQRFGGSERFYLGTD